jgi:hypothetical protein
VVVSNLSIQQENGHVVPIDATYLREQAQRCVRLARTCPHRPTSHELEVIGQEFMERAAELEALLAMEMAEKKSRSTDQ